MPTHIKGARIYTGSGKVIAKGDILIDAGVIQAIGKHVRAPAHANTIDAEGKVVTPGLIDVYTQMGLTKEPPQTGSRADKQLSLTPEFRAIDGIYPEEKTFEEARKSGVTTVHILPGTNSIFGGESAVVKTSGSIVDNMILRNPAGMAGSFSASPGNSGGPDSSALMETVAQMREAFKKAQTQLHKINNGITIDENLALENLIKVLNREYPLRVKAELIEEIAAVLRIAREFSIQVTIENTKDAHRIADFIGEQGARISIAPGLMGSSPSKRPAKEWDTIAALDEAGIPVSITTAYPQSSISTLLSSAAMAVRSGLKESSAWKAITLNAARHLGISKRVGSLNTGKDADLVIWSGEPFDLRNDVEKTIINGQIVYNASKRYVLKQKG
ncbi:amidohydrolase family protein [Bacillus marinisedimentorum]|uniref:amidohydrolase family protein n=1 Tax=Bacillus marinisedimentorum TaxID=1821260 RepID=UPI0007E0044A|nr:amidohydrolase family protein [Bacillus marinisedimentorum]